MGKQAGRVGAEQPDTLLECGSLDVLLRLMDGVWSTVARWGRVNGCNLAMRTVDQCKN